MPAPLTKAEEHQQVFEIGLERLRQSTLLVFRTMTDGLPKQYRKHAREIIRFFEEETTPEVFEELSYLEDPDNPGTSIAASWLATWEHMMAAVGRKSDGDDSGAGARDRADSGPVDGRGAAAAAY